VFILFGYYTIYCRLSKNNQGQVIRRESHINAKVAVLTKMRTTRPKKYRDCRCGLEQARARHESN